MDKYSDTVFLIREISKQHKKFEHEWHHVNNNPSVANDTIYRKKESGCQTIE